MLRIQTLGGFRVWINDHEIPPTAWTREKALHLLHLLITLRRKRPHKEQIVDILWPDLDPEIGDRDFRVALNALQNALEPDRAPRTPSQYVIRSELNYNLNLGEIWLDVEEFEKYLAADNLQDAIALYHGEYLPERRYEDWTTAERERLHTLALSAMTRLAERLLPSNPLESIRLTRRVLELDPLWENAYRIEMQAHLSTGNRPVAIRVYEQCKKVMMEEFGLEPLPETRQLYKKILGSSILESNE